MPRARKHPPAVYLALPAASIAVALGIREQVVYDAIDAGQLGPVYMSPTGNRQRILVSDVERWVRTWPQQSKRTRKVPK